MKKLIITSACTLVLSLLGAFGANQNNINTDKILDTNSNTTIVEENVTDKEINQSLPSDNQTTVAENAAEVTNIDANEVTPQAITLKTNSSNSVNAISGNVRAQQVVSRTKNGKKYGKTKNKNVYVYKNVDLSKCDSVKDVVKELQKNGYKNITKSNIKNVKALQDILAIIKAGSNSTPAPTTKPSPTTVPAPSTTPEPTTKPAPTTAPAPTTKPSANTGVSNYANEVLRLVNIERAKAGLGAFTTNQTISGAANQRAKEIVQSFAHTRPNGTSFSTALDQYGVSYRAAGENIAWGQRSPQEVVTGWMNSPGHRANILNGNFNKIGIGVYQTNGVLYWTQLFTN